MRKIYLSLLFALAFAAGKAQITGPTGPVPINTPVNFTTTKGGNEYVWVFDTINVNSTVTPAIAPKRVLAANASMQGGCSAIVYDSAAQKYFGFWGNWNGGMYKMDFGNSPLNTPTVTAVSYTSSFTCNDNGAIDVVYDAANASWYAFWGGRRTSPVTNQLLRVEFGNSLANAPVNSSVISNTSIGYPFQLTTKKVGNEWIMFATNNYGNVWRMDFGTSLTNAAPTLTVLPGTASSAGNLSLYEEAGSWYMIVTGTTSLTSFRYSFGTDLKNNAPTMSTLVSTGGTNKAILLYPNKECGNQVFGYGVDEQLRLQKFNFNGSITNTPTFSSLGTFFSNRSFAMSSILHRDTIYAAVTEFNNKNLVIVPILSLTPGTIKQYYNPAITKTFTAPGTYKVTLMVDAGNPAGPSTYCTTVTVVAGPNQPAEYTVAKKDVCQNENSVNYTVPAVSGATSYEWLYTGTGATFSGGATTTNPTNSISFSATATSGSVRVRAVDANGSSPYRDTTITMNTLPAQPGAFTASTATVCQGQTGVAYTVPSVSGLTYTWSYTGGGTGVTYTGGTANSVTAAFGNTATSGTVQVTPVSMCGAGPVRAMAVTVNPLAVQPGAFTTSSATVCQGQNNVTYTVPNVSGTTYAWSYTGGTGTTITGTTNSVTVSFSNTATSGTLSVTPSTTCGAGTPRTMAITVNPLPSQPGAFTASPATVCQGQNNVVYTVPNVSGTTYAWSYTGGTGASITNNGNSASINFATTATAGTVSVTATNSCATSTARTTSVTVNPLPNIPGSFLTSTVTVCQGQQNVSYEITNATGVTYAWSYNGGSGATVNGNGNTATVHYSNTATSGTLQVIPTNACGSSPALTLAVNVGQRPTASVTPAGPMDICENTNVTLTAGTGQGYTYQWKNGITAVNGTGNTLSVNTTGRYKVVVTNSNSNCKDSTQEVVITSHSLPKATITPGDTAFCDGGKVTLNVATQDTGLSYQWKKGASPVSQATVAFMEVSSTGTYSVVLSRTMLPTCKDSTTAVTVTVHPLPTPVVTWDGVKVHTGTGYVSYQWNLNAQMINGAKDSTFEAVSNGAYTVTVTDSNGCSNTSTVLNVNNVGIEEVGASSALVKVYPNPSSDKVYIVTPDKSNITLIAMDGKILLQQTNAKLIDISNYADGMYLLRITNNDGALLANERIVKQAR